MEKLKIEDLNYQEILKNVTLDVMEERLTMIAGTNGSGKTTLLKLLAGLLKSDGEITYKDVNEPELFCKVGLLSGDHGHMHEAKSVEETLQKTLLDHNKTTKNVMSIQKRVVKLCNLDNILHQSLRDLNAFDLQKLRLAQLLCQKKELLLLDDPCRMFSTFERGSFLAIIKNVIQEEQCTVVMTTTTLDDTLSSDYLYIMDQGKIILEGKPLSVLKEERILTHLGLALPFMVDLSLKLQDYEVLDDIYLNMEKMVDALWK